MELLLDANRSISIDDLIRSSGSPGPAWQTVTVSDTLNQGFYPGRLYIRISLPESMNGRYRIRFRNVNLEYVDFINPMTLAIDRQGMLTDSEPLFPSHIVDTSLNRSLLIRVDSRTPYRLPLEITPESQWSKLERMSGVVPAIVTGAALTLFAYYFLLWRKTGDRSSLFFLPYLLFLTTHRMIYHGLLSSFLKPDYGFLQLPLSLFTVLAATLILLLWTNHFLRSLVLGLPMRFLTQICVMISVVLIIMIPIDPHLTNRLTYITSLPFSLYLILLGFSAARIGYGPAVYFGLSVLMFPISMVVFLLFTYGSSSLPPMVDYAVDLSFLLQMLLMAVAIVDGLRNEIQTAKDELGFEVKLRTVELQSEVQARTRAQQAAEEANRAKSHFLANISHEIRTPMNVILGTNELLREQPDIPDEQRRLLAAMHSSGISLLQILDDVLQTSRLELGQIRIEESEFLLRDWIDGVCRPFAVQMKANGVQFHLNIDHLPDRLVGDAVSISQILSNLLSNATKFTKQGSVSLDVTGEKSGPDDDARFSLQFILSDTGIGIPSSEHRKIFEPFSPSSERTVAQYGGTGLGLSIARSLTSLLKGSLTMTPMLSGGSRFALTLPVRISAEKVENTAPASERFINARILLAEDQPENRFLFDRFLKRHVRELIFAEDGAQAVSAFSSEAFDLVLMDIRMPIMDGYEAYSRIREFEHASGRNHCPVLALTAHAMDSDQDRLRETGFDEILTKPVRKIELLDAIARHTHVVRPG